MTTLLTPHQQSQQEIEEANRRRAEEEKALDALQFILSGFFSAYKNGDITLNKYIDYVHNAVKAENIPPFQRQKKLGAAVEAALNCSPAKRNSQRAGKRWMVEPNYLLIQMVKEREGLPITRGSRNAKQTAFERVSEIWNIRGVRTTPSKVQKLYEDASNTQ